MSGREIEGLGQEMSKIRLLYNLTNAYEFCLLIEMGKQLIRRRMTGFCKC
jgi:hypothetical protein